MYAFIFFICKVDAEQKSVKYVNPSYNTSEHAENQLYREYSEQVYSLEERRCAPRQDTASAEWEDY